MAHHIDRDTLLDYVDGTLSHHQRRRVDDLLATSPELRAEVEALHRLRRRIRTTLGNVDQQPGRHPTGWAEISRRTIYRNAPRRRVYRTVRAAALFGLLGLVVLLFMNLLRHSYYDATAGIDGLEVVLEEMTALPSPVSTVQPTPFAIITMPSPTNSPIATPGRSKPPAPRSAPILRAFFEAYNRHDVAAVIALLDPIDYTDCSVKADRATHMQTREVLGAWLTERFRLNEFLSMKEFTLQEWREDLGRPMTADMTATRMNGDGTSKVARILFTFTATDRIAKVQFVCPTDPAQPTPLHPENVVTSIRTDLVSLQKALPWPLWQPDYLPPGIGLTAVYRLDSTLDELGAELRYEGAGTWVRITQSMPSGPVGFTQNPKLRRRTVDINGQTALYFDPGGPSHIPEQDRLTLRWVDDGRLVEMRGNVSFDELVDIARSLAPH